MNEERLRFAIKIDKMWDSYWSFGMCFSHSCGETYIFINFFKWSISIGKIFV